MPSKIAIALHGGAGTILRSEMTPEKEMAYTSGLREALDFGYQALSDGMPALDVVEKTLNILEDNPLFNAGRGSVFNHKGKHEMDAAIMCGDTLKAGAVACVKLVKNPISLARAVMEYTDHVMLCSVGAEEFGRLHGIVFESEEYFFSEQRYNDWQKLKNTTQTELDHSSDTSGVKDKKFGTAGVVAKDMHGNLAAATSTGGMTNKQYSRIGDTPIIGAGTYANNDTCAISCTGHGEYFMRAVAAYDISCLMQYQNYSLQDACEKVVLDKLFHRSGEGGVIAVDREGNISLIFNSAGMYRASQSDQSPPFIGIYK
jgi:beta-aspartyl-peptidase (threonine type)